MNIMAENQQGSAFEIEGFIEDQKLNNINYLTHNRSYEKVGSTQTVIAEPSVVHFGGFELGRTYSQVLSIRNVNSKAIRLHIIPTTTPYFKTTCHSKRGNIAPGLAESITIEFVPDQFKYYYDCVRINLEGENLLVPVHGYPVMNETRFPKRVDFGKRAIGEEVVKKVNLECKVPVEFEYEILETKPNNSFKVSPMQGVVPAHGDAVIEIAFCPLSFSTEEMIIEVRVAELNSKPVVCTITGSGFPGMAKDRILRESLGPGTFTPDKLDGTAALKTASKGWSVNQGGGLRGGGAGNGDAYTVTLQEERRELAASRDCRQDGPIQGRRPTLPAPLGETEVDGVFVPDTSLMSNAEMSYVLNQRPDRLRIKNIRIAVEDKQRQIAREKSELEAVMGAVGELALHPLSRPDISNGAKAALFDMLRQGAEEATRKVALGGATAIGDDPMTKEEVARVHEAQEKFRIRHEIQEDLRAIHQHQPELQECGALHLRGAAGRGGASSPGRDAGDGGGASAPRDASASSSAEGGSTVEPFRPQWRTVEGNDWAKRSAALDKFIGAARTVIRNRRLQKRLAKIKHVLKQLKYDKQRVAEETTNPVLLSADADRPSAAPTRYMQPARVRVRPLPLYRDVNFTRHDPVEPTHYADLTELSPFGTQVPLEFKMLGYQPEPPSSLTPYLPPLTDQPLLTGAEEEFLGPVPSGVVPDPETRYRPLPESLRSSIYVSLELGSRYTDVRVVSPPEQSWGLDTEYSIQPRVYPFHDSTKFDSLPSLSVRALRGAKQISDSWVARLDTWFVQLRPERVPEPLTAAAPDDVMPDLPGDADKPRLQIRVPSEDEDMAPFFPDGVSFALPSSRPESSPSAAAGMPPSSPAAPKPSSTALSLVREQKLVELNVAKEAQHADTLADIEQKYADYNKLLKFPCYHALGL